MKENVRGLSLERKSGVPLYIQLKNQIKRRIQMGYWLPGHQLPTERELAEELEISRNTVSSAYRDLELEGILVSYQGRGTFVAGVNGFWRQEDKKERLLKVIDLAMEEATQMAFSLDEFLRIVLHRAQEKKDFLGYVRVGFVAGNQEQVEYFGQEISSLVGASVKPVLISRLEGDRDALIEEFSGIDLIVTTFFYLNEVRERLRFLAKPVIGIALNLNPDTLVELARVKGGEKVGLVCRSKGFAQAFQLFLEQAGLGQLDLITTQTTDQGELNSFLNQVNVVAVSFDRKEEIFSLVKGNKKVIELRYRPDRGSVNLIRSAVLELQNNTTGK